MKELQRDSGCKMLIRGKVYLYGFDFVNILKPESLSGKGSVKLKHGETDEELSKNPTHAHLAEQLHIIVDYEGPLQGKDQAISRGDALRNSPFHFIVLTRPA